MSARLILRMTAPVVAISLLLLAFGVGAAWYVSSWQKRVARELRLNTSGIRAGEELEILLWEARAGLYQARITGDRAYLKQVLELRPESERWLREAESWEATPREQQLMVRVRQGLRHFWDELERVAALPPGADWRDETRRLIDDVLVPEVHKPAHDYLDRTEEEVTASIAKNQDLAERLVYGLLLLGTCGSAAGLVAGFGFARGLSRSLVQLSVLVRDTAGRLEEGFGPITFSQGHLGELENVLRLIADRVRAIVERLQQRERDFLLAVQLAAVGQLAAGMAHELRNPLTSMKLLVQGAQAEAAGESGREDGWLAPRLSGRDLSILEEEISRLEQLIQSFLDFARPPRPEKRVVDLRSLVEQTTALLAGRAAAASTRLETVLPPQPALGTVDPGQVRQVLLNLVLNALDASAGEGVVTVTLERDGDGWLALRVADRGCGLPAALGERIFDPFTTTTETGLGLGLSICKRIAAAHGGTLSAANRPGGGAVFTLRLPPGEESVRNQQEGP
jgi:signal transduction histidine kinase